MPPWRGPEGSRPFQRVINGGDRIEREYGLDRGALDLLISSSDEQHPIEIKLRRDTETETDALDQLARYLDQLGLTEGWLVGSQMRFPLAPQWALKDLRGPANKATV